MNKKVSGWEYFKRTSEIIQLLIVIFGVCFTAYQVNEIVSNQLSRENQLSLLYYDRLNSGVNRKIFSAINHDTLIIKKFSTDDIDDFLNNLHDVGERVNQKQLDGETTCSDFADLTEKTWKNAEIQKYISDSRQADETYFQGFDTLHQFVIENCY